MGAQDVMNSTDENDSHRCKSFRCVPIWGFAIDNTRHEFIMVVWYPGMVSRGVIPKSMRAALIVLLLLRHDLARKTSYTIGALISLRYLL